MTDMTESADCETALVTGGTSGLGLAMAPALAGAGVRVAVASRSGERAADAAAPLPGAFGVAMDVRDHGSVASAVATAWSRLGGIDPFDNPELTLTGLTSAIQR
jgi:NAD(P)-dependent dehydrogenase (short-subunit alcohol dehydrogenase family)